MTHDPEIISSGNPHEVHLPEGSRTAVHKTATPMQPQVRNTMANPDEEVELVEVVKGVSTSQEDDIRMARGESAATPEADRMLNVATAERPERMVVDANADETPDLAPAHALPLSQVMSELPSLDLPATEANSIPASRSTDPETQESIAPTAAAQEAAAQADTEISFDEVVAQADVQATPAEVTAPPQFMEEMNFPARVVKLKMANDQVRGQIEKLEKPLFPPIPVEAPAAPKGKGKDKEPAAKPAKGH